MHRSIAVIIPAYNAQAYICEALGSVAGQTRPPEEIIVVDDGSTDQTADVVREWVARERVDVQLLHQENRGASAARNTAIRHAKTDLIAPLDADDLFLPHHLWLLEGAFKRHSDLVLCFGDSQDFSPAGIVRQSILAGTLIKTLEYDEETDRLRLIRGSAYTSLVPACYIPTSGTLFVKKGAEDIGLFDETFINANDRDFLLRLSRVGRFGYYPTLVAAKRTHADNITHPRHLVRAQRSRLGVLQKMIACAQGLGLSLTELQHTRTAASHQAWEMLYFASRKGLLPYFETCVYLMRRGFLTRVCNLKHLLRDVAFCTVMRKVNENDLAQVKQGGKT